MYSLLQKPHQYLSCRALYTPKIASSECCQSCFLFPWVTPTDKTGAVRGREFPARQGHSHQTHPTRSAGRTGGSHSAVWWCSAPGRNLLWRSLHTDFLAPGPNQTSRPSKSEGQAPSQPWKTRRVPPCWQARGETQTGVQYAQHKEAHCLYHIASDLNSCSRHKWRISSFSLAVTFAGKKQTNHIPGGGRNVFEVIITHFHFQSTFYLIPNLLFPLFSVCPSQLYSTKYFTNV